MKKSCNAQGSSKYYLFVTAPFFDTFKGGKYKQLNISTIVIKCVQIYSKESFKMNTSNFTNYKPKDFSEFLGVSV